MVVQRRKAVVSILGLENQRRFDTKYIRGVDNRFVSWISNDARFSSN